MPKWNEEPRTLDAFEERGHPPRFGDEGGALPLRTKTFGTDGSRATALQSCQISCDDNTAGCRGWSDAGDCGSETCYVATPLSPTGTEDGQGRKGGARGQAASPPCLNLDGEALPSRPNRQLGSRWGQPCHRQSPSPRPPCQQEDGLRDAASQTSGCHERSIPAIRNIPEVISQ